MYKKMLVPLDGSEIAEVVFAYAKELTGRLGLDVLLLHVCTPEEHELRPMHQVYIEHAAETVKFQSEEVGKRVGTNARSKRIKATGLLSIGYPAEEILRCADDNNVDLILMATHGHSAMKRWNLGSVADKVLRAAHVPVWLTRAGIPYEIVYDKYPDRKMMVPLDGSELAESVFPHVVALAKQRGAELVNIILIRVCETPVMPSEWDVDIPKDWLGYVEQHTTHARQVAKEYLTATEERFRNAGLRAQSVVLVGQPASEIAGYADTHPINLVVMSTHGSSGNNWWPWGSVAGKVLERISNPLLLVRPKQMRPVQSKT